MTIRDAVRQHEYIEEHYGYMKGAGKWGYFLALLYLAYSITTRQAFVEFSYCDGHEFPWRFHVPLSIGWCNQCGANITYNYILPTGYQHKFLTDVEVILFDSTGTEFHIQKPTLETLRSRDQICENKLLCIGVNNNGNYYIYYRDEDAVSEGFTKSCGC